MSKTLLLEIGTEEIPAHVMPGILAQLKDNGEKLFKDLRIAYDTVESMGTPRRLALVVKGLEEKQQDLTKENRGPAVGIAFDGEGKATKAAEGFARGQGISADALTVRDGYVYALVHEKGAETVSLLGEALTNLINGLNFPNNMHWANLDYKFIRPLRWIVALYGAEIIDLEVAEVRSGRISRGHRFLSEGEFSIPEADAYEESCREQFVIVDQEKRCEMIRSQIEAVAKEHGGEASIEENLLEEVLYLVEYPTALCGSFDESYLSLPAEAVITPMRDHQRYFPVLKEGKLLPLFITIRNGGSEHLEVVQHGNERVLRARLEDARFFFDEDRKKSLEEHGEKLKTVVFQDGLGTIYDKSLRLEALADYIADEFKATAEEKAEAVRAAKLAKADLVTGMVCEFTELQGIMGREYALLDGEATNVAKAIDEHYMPRFAGDAQPATVAGRIVSLADKIDNLVATFSRGLVPTGSQDPFGLRRQAIGIVNMLIEAELSISLTALTDKAMDLLHIEDEKKRAKLQGDMTDFMRLRMKNILSEAGVRYDVVEAVFADTDDILAVYHRGMALNNLVAVGMEKTIQAVVRVGNIARKDGVEPVFSQELLNEQVEKDLFAAYEGVKATVEAELGKANYEKAFKALDELATPIDNFFDGVMVMDKDEKIRTNRLSLMKLIDALVYSMADFSKIVMA